ncbi:MAG: alpha-amylase family glycosyl hydrolase, partial [Thermoguttaceae bacterium]
MELTDPQKDRLRQRLGEIYGPVGEVWTDRFVDLLGPLPSAEVARRPSWDEGDAVLIAYADHVGDEGEYPLRAFRRFLLEHRLDEMFSTVHLLPLFRSSSDDGFSVIDYTRVEPTLGDWDDLRALGYNFDLMLDLVLNHVSQRSRWFEEYLSGEEPGVRYFHEVEPSADLSAVTRPRSLPLLTEFDTSRGRRHVWTTFSADQVDLNYGEPQVLWEISRVLLDYVGRGARMVRLDAIGYLWKEIGTSCIHR